MSQVSAALAVKLEELGQKAWDLYLRVGYTNDDLKPYRFDEKHTAPFGLPEPKNTVPLKRTRPRLSGVSEG